MKKDFTLEVDVIAVQAAGKTASEAVDTPVDRAPVSKPANTAVAFPENTTGHRSADFGRFYGQGFDDITIACQLTLEKLTADSLKTNGQVISITTVLSYFSNGFKSLASYLSLLRSVCEADITMADLTTETFRQFVHHLRTSALGSSAQKNSYSHAKNLLVNAHRFGFWDDVDIKSVFPQNPFPGSNRLSRGERPLSKNEKRQVVRGLRLEMERIVGEAGPLTAFDLTICVLSIALSTGLNPTPILELLTDCVQPHPLKANLRLLVSFKRRGRNTQVVSLRKSQDVAEMASIHLHAADAISLIVERNADIRASYSEPQRLLVHESRGSKNQGTRIRLNARRLSVYSSQFVERHQMVTDDGKPMTLNVSRLRKTLLNRVWELSGQDPLITAKTGQHSPQTGNAHYWEAPPEAEANMRFIGEARVKELLEKANIIATDKTPMGSCKDTKHGQRAPKNGSICTDFLACFRCKSFVVTEDDLYRLFSFYWAAIRGHDSFGGKRWTKYLRQVIRLIDSEIASQFDRELVNVLRNRAKKDPHPFWRDLSMARMTI
tara:strand:- start:1970 stop:3616 length:1647 start_codon:yes stop_codon:yes gene_type:complete